MSDRFSEYHSDPTNIINEMKTYLENRQRSCYGRVTGLCNPILDKNPYSSQFLQYYLENETKPFPLLLFLKNTLLFLFNVTKGLSYHCLLILFSPKVRLKERYSILVSDFFNYDRKSDGVMGNLYFPGLQAELQEENVDYLYFPKLYMFPRNPMKALIELAEIRKKNEAFVSPYHVVPRSKIFELIALSIRHYVELVRSLRPFSPNQTDQIYDYALIELLKDSHVDKYLTFIAGRELASNTQIDRAIVWYENQVIDKCLVRGLRENKQVRIYGCEFYLIVPQMLNVTISAFEREGRLCPDEILSIQDVASGTRYNYVMKTEPGFDGGAEPRLTALLALYEWKNKIVYDFLLDTHVRDLPLALKKHPGNPFTLIPARPNWREVSDSMEKLTSASDILFVTDSGSMFEAMAMGKQVIIIGAPRIATPFLPPTEYREKLWVRVDDPKDLRVRMESLLRFKRENQGRFAELVREVRAKYFEPGKKSLVQVTLSDKATASNSSPVNSIW